MASGAYIGDYALIDLSADVKFGQTLAIGPHCTILKHYLDYKEENISARWEGSPKLGSVYHRGWLLDMCECYNINGRDHW